MLCKVAPASMFALLLAVSAQAAVEIRPLTEIIEGHQVGGVTADMVGDLYVADFGETVWKITLEGERRVFATGLRGPVGVAVDRKTGEVYVANCRGNSVAKISPDGVVAPFASSDLFKCPNGITLDRDGTVYTVNFRDNRMLKIDRAGKVTPFATISDKGLGHVCFSSDRFYVTAYHSHQIFQVSLDGKATRILGNGDRGLVDGPDGTARLTFPNGIACHPWGERLYINEYVGETSSSIPRRAIVRQIILERPPP